MSNELNFPKTSKIDREISLHGKKLVDPYFWLKNREDIKVKELLDEENKQLEAYLSPHQKIKDKIYEELKTRIKDDDVSVPEKDGDYFYYSKDKAGSQYKVYYRKKIGTENEEVLIDVNELAEGKKFLKLGLLSVSPSQDILAYALDEKGDEVYSVYFKNLKTGKILSDKLTNVSPGIAWQKDNQKIYYTQFDGELRPRFVYAHSLGDEQKNDSLIFTENDLTYFVDVENSRDNEYIFINSAGQTSNEIIFKSSGDMSNQFKPFLKRKKNHEYNIDHIHGNFIILSNDKHENFRLAMTPVSAFKQATWKALIKPSQEHLLEGFLVFENFIAVQKRIKGQSYFQILSGVNFSESHMVQIPGESFSVDFLGNPDFKSEYLRFSYTSLKTPPTVYDYQSRSRELSLLKQKNIPSYKTEDYQEKRIEVTSIDNKKIPVNIIYHSTKYKKDGSAPFYLIGYGAYGHSYDPHFLQNLISLVDRGFAVGIAQIRGGSELGRSWYKDGKFLKKKNTFLDFISVAEFLKKDMWVHSDKLVISGRSAGGLLMGAVTNMRPDLFKVVIAGVPFVDLMNTMLDDSLPLTTIEYEEWGNPKDKKYFNYMLSYSPYDNVVPQKYPYVLATAGFTDPRVTYWEPAKWIQKIRENNNGKNLQFLSTDMESGHFGSSGRYDHLKEKVTEFTFILKVLGMIDEKI